jgi:hypothetical protein
MTARAIAPTAPTSVVRQRTLQPWPPTAPPHACSSARSTTDPHLPVEGSLARADDPLMS